MKNLFLIVCCILCLDTFFVSGQTINIQAGTSLSKLDWVMDETNYFNNTLIGYSAFAGIDYMDSRYFNLSSNLGYVRKGGRDKIIYINLYGVETGTDYMNASLDYLSFNTAVDVKVPINNIVPYLCFGPRIDFLIMHHRLYNGIDDMGGLNSVSYGLLFGGGIKYDMPTIQFGIKAEYYLNFNKVAEWSPQNNLNYDIKDNTLLLSVTIGFKLAKAQTSTP
jgi:hypothetical protein